MENEIYHKWLSQLRKGYLELCVLIALNNKHSSYGFELLQIFEKVGIDLNEGTLYPLLNRMHKNGWLESNWKTPTERGHPRRFYQLSDTGKSLLPEMLKIHELNQQSLKQLTELS